MIEPFVTDVDSVELDEDNDNESLEDGSTRVLRKCTFCEKETVVYQHTDPLLTRLSGPNNFHCTFCLRHDFHTKKHKNVLITSFRGIIGYLYYAGYRIPVSPKLYLSELHDLIATHKKIGLLNPAFSYDDESFYWFIDFNKISTEHRKKAPLQSILDTTSEIITGFNVFEYIDTLNLHTLVKKYHDAITAFYETRRRDGEWKVLTPTLKGCGVVVQVKVSNAANNHTTKKVPIEETRHFTPDMIQTSPMR